MERMSLTTAILACNLAGAVFVYLFVYESANLSLEGVDDVRINSSISFGLGLTFETDVQ